MSCISTNLCNISVLKNIQGSCDNAMFSGADQVGILINKADIKGVVYDSNNKRIVTDITLASGATAYRVVNPKNQPFSGTNTALVVGDYGNTFTRTVSFYIPIDGANTAEKVIEPIAMGSYVVILQNDWKGDNDVYEYQIYGLDKGLKTTDMNQTLYENEGYWVVTATEEGVKTSGKWLQHVVPYSGSNTFGSTIESDSTSGGWIYPTITIGSTSTAIFIDDFDGAQNRAVGHYVEDGVDYTVTLTYETTSTTYSSISVMDGKLFVDDTSFSTSDWSAEVTAMGDQTCDYLVSLLGE